MSQLVPKKIMKMLKQIDKIEYGGIGPTFSSFSKLVTGYQMVHED